MNTPSEDDPVGSLVRQAGRREEPSEPARQRVFAATHALWQADLRRRRLRRQWLAAAATLAAVGIGSVLFLARAPAELVATWVRGGEDARVLRGGQSLALTAQMPQLRSGDRISSGMAGIVVRGTDGLMLRIAAGTQLRWTSPAAVQLDRGSLYIDSDMAGPDGLVVQAAGSRVRHVGTRFALQADAAQVRVAVRDGIVEVLPPGGTPLLLTRGQVLQATAAGQLRQEQGGDVRDWGWVEALAPATTLDGRVLYEVLAELAHEAGLQLRFASARLEADAHALRLSGQPLSLPPRTALTAVLAATPLAASVDNEVVLITVR